MTLPVGSTAITDPTTPANQLKVNADGSINTSGGGGGGTQYTDGAAAPAHPVGGTIEFNNAGTWATVSAASPLPVSATVTPAANQRVNAQSGDFLTGSIADLATLLTLSGTPTDANTINSLMGRLTKIRDLLLGTLAISAASLPLPSGAAIEAGHLATIDTSTAKIPSQGAATVATSLPITNAAVQGWIAPAGTGTANQDDALTFANQVRKVVLYNASSNPVPIEFDQTSTSASFPIQPGQYLVFDDVLCTVVHVFPSALLPINTTSGLYVKGWK